MVDKETLILRIEEKFSNLDKYTSTISSISPKNYEAYEKLPIAAKWEIERGLQLISEVEIDMIVLLNKLLKKGPVGEEKSLIDAVSKELGEKVIKSVKNRRKLRNDLVHAYTLNNEEDVFVQAKDLNDVTDFKRAVSVLLKN